MHLRVVPQPTLFAFVGAGSLDISPRIIVPMIITVIVIPGLGAALGCYFPPCGHLNNAACLPGVIYGRVRI